MNRNLVGHDKAITLLEGARRRGNLAHAYLLVGPPGVGKMTLALELAMAVNCPAAEPPCGQCRSCRRIAGGKHCDVRTISLATIPRNQDGTARKEVGIDDIKQLQNDASLPPFEGRRKLFIIDGAEHLSSAAANCLLKTLEEPPSGVILVLLSAREDRLLPTVVSRCQRIEMLPLPAAELEAALRQRGIAPEKAAVLARLSRGCPGWALAAAADSSILDQRSQELEPLLSLEHAGLEQRFAAAGRMAARFQKQREKVEAGLELWQNWWRDLLLVKNGAGQLATNADRVGRLQEGAGVYALEEIRRAIVSLREARRRLEQNVNPRLALEVLMLEMPGRPTQ